MTEEEAKTKWCPMVRAGRNGANGYVAVNWPEGGLGIVGVPEWAKCQGSNCMMWRVSPNDVRTGRKVTVIEGDRVRVVDETVETGYCGIAGTQGHAL